MTSPQNNVQQISKHEKIVVIGTLSALNSYKKYTIECTFSSPTPDNETLSKVNSNDPIFTEKHYLLNLTI